MWRAGIDTVRLPGIFYAGPAWQINQKFLSAWLLQEPVAPHCLAQYGYLGAGPGAGEHLLFMLPEPTYSLIYVMIWMPQEHYDMVKVMIKYV